MKIKGKILVAFMVLLVTTISATATVEKNNGVDLHASFDNEEGTIVTISAITTMDGNIGLLVSRDVRNQTGYPISLAYGWKVISDEDLKVKNNLASADLVVSNIVLRQYYPCEDEIVLDNITVNWEATDKAEVTKYKWDDPYPDTKLNVIRRDANATGYIDGAPMGSSLYISMYAWEIMNKV